MNIHEELAKVTGREEFVAFVHRLTEDLQKNPDKWANITLEDYLLSIASWVEDGSQVQERIEECRNVSTARPVNVQWERLAFLLFAAGRYE
ncbi:hypothetical protein [Saccharibacillus sp. JS10]|uniref:DUF7660 family protein n=1 Tax=Saccharibacillus sp. JS10 TaxID=2950552 RepID=UPI00210CD92A|nr:hypothetical protein [Saccharibacillus sp. JS10]MCQ4086384.1 hypothetical protein [Saccharibacillus sp. JS10]